MSPITPPVVQKLLPVVNAMILVAWPCMIWGTVISGYSLWLVLLFIPLFLLCKERLTDKKNPLLYAGRSLALISVSLGVATLLLRKHHLLLYYPVAVNLLLLLLFGGSLFYGRPIVEQLARLQESLLPPEGVRYTRRVTQVWCLFFVVNGGVAWATCLPNHRNLWLLWNGFLSYLFMGGLMGAEWWVRQRIKKR